MNAFHVSSILGGALVLTLAACSSHEAQSSHAKEPRLARDTPTAEERRAIEARRAEERRAEERRAEERNYDDRHDRFIGGGPPEPNTAVAKIASARCEREVRCNNVGYKAKYPSRADCVLHMQDDKREDINERDCPGGIDKKQLNACLTAIRDESCGNALESISRLVSCRSSGMCLK